MAHRTRTLVPTHKKLLTQSGHWATATKLASRKARQERQYNKKSRPLDPLRYGQAIRMRLPGKQEWTLGTCTRVLRNRSYEVEVCGRRYRRNRRQLRSTPEIPPPISSQDLGPPDIYPHKAWDPELETTHNYEQDKSEPPVTIPSVNNEVNAEPEVESIPVLPCHSNRRRSPPVWQQDYHMN